LRIGFAKVLQTHLLALSVPQQTRKKTHFLCVKLKSLLHTQSDPNDFGRSNRSNASPDEARVTLKKDKQKKKKKPQPKQ
jgi:hypothetical protein